MHFVVAINLIVQKSCKGERSNAKDNTDEVQPSMWSQSFVQISDPC